MKLSVVICTHNRSELLQNTLESINKVLIPDLIDLSILVIANACHDDTIKRLIDYQQNGSSGNPLPLAYSEEPTPGKSHALNKALDIVTEGWICFVDDDHRLDYHYFQSIVAAIAEYPDTKLFCGKIIPDWTGNEPPWAHETGEFKITPFPVPYFDLGDQPLMLSKKKSIPGGGNLIVARKVFDRVGRFSKALGPKGHDLMGSEDSDFVLRALQAGEVLRYIPNIVQYHYVNPKHFELTYVMKKSFQRNRSITLAHHPEQSGIPRYLWNKLMHYLIKMLFCNDKNKFRFYLTRTCGVIGQMTGYLQTKNP